MKLSRLLVVILALGAMAAQAGERVDQRVAAEPNGKVRIENLAGSVQVSGWDRAEVHVEGELGDGVERLELESEGDYTRIKVIYPNGSRNVRGDTHLSIKIPENSQLETSTVSADVDVRRVRGRLDVNTVSGDVSADEASREYSLKTVSGSIRLAGSQADARINAASVSGDVILNKVNGEVEGASVSGDLRFDGRFTRLNVENVSGDIEVAGEFDAAGRFAFQATSGDVILRFAGKPAGRFDLTTFSGDIGNDFGPEPRRTSRYAPGMELRFEEGGSRAEFRVNTLSGDIELNRR